MDITQFTTGQYLKAIDLEEGSDYTATIVRAVQIEIEGESKLSIVTSLGKIVLNKTNCRNLSILGHDTDAWIGRDITIRREMTSFQGKSMPGIRVYPAAETPVPETRPAGTAKREVRPLPRGTPTAGARRQQPSDSDMPF
jgi:hypothetical protein